MCLQINCMLKICQLISLINKRSSAFVSSVENVTFLICQLVDQRTRKFLLYFIFKRRLVVKIHHTLGYFISSTHQFHNVDRSYSSFTFFRLSKIRLTPDFRSACQICDSESLIQFFLGLMTMITPIKVWIQVWGTSDVSHF